MADAKTAMQNVTITLTRKEAHDIMRGITKDIDSQRRLLVKEPEGPISSARRELLKDLADLYKKFEVL